jgi:CheY-like chemotaxis protein
VSRILIVDDDLDILEALAGVLEDNHQVSTASNGAEALRQVSCQTFDAVVLDLMMPVMDGETLLEKMRELGVVVPVLLASASADLTLLAARLGVEHIAKPYDIALLEQKLARLVGGSP